MDLFDSDAHYRVVVYRRYRYAVMPNEILRHLRSLYNVTEGPTVADVRQCAQRFLPEPLDLLEATRRLQVSFLLTLA
jgi:hypothetical protein